MIEDMLIGTSEKIWAFTLASRTILTMVKSIKYTIVYSKMLTICKKFRRRVATWHALPKREMNGCALWMRRDGLYTSQVVGSKTINIGYIKQDMYSM